MTPVSLQGWGDAGPRHSEEQELGDRLPRGGSPGHPTGGGPAEGHQGEDQCPMADPSRAVAG